MSFEGFAESRFRFITDAQRRLADREVPFREQPRRLPQPPTRQVSERRLAHQGAEFRRKDRARHRHFAGQRGDAPVPLRLAMDQRSEEHTSELQSLRHLVCRLLLEKKKKKKKSRDINTKTTS